VDAIRAWLAAGCPPAVLVTVAAVEGSVPRGPGTHMLVSDVRQWGTVGGGHLELRAAEVSRALLAGGGGADVRHCERFALGPGLGQCCGGIVHLAFEPADRAHLAALAQAFEAGEDRWRVVALDAAPDRCSERALFDAQGTLHAGTATGAAPAFAFDGGTRIVRAPDGRRWLLDLVAAPRTHLMLFGAGHVGTAIVRAMAPLPCRITWVDERAELFPSDAPAHVAVEATDTPEALVDAAPPGTAFLVMTHSHALDGRLAEAILRRSVDPRRPDWFGLIGSQTKRRQFEHRLRERGIPAARLETMVCPIGIPGIEGKEPAVIAIAVAAQLLAVWRPAPNASPYSERH
jgi:xanthine dehydrogenase accessory factor